MDDSELWSGFALDPRVPAHAGIRASDADRDRVQSVLADGFADGRLDREEYDERSSALVASRTLGELPPLVDDLVPVGPPTGNALVQRSSAADLELRAQRHWEAERRRALFGFLGPTLITWIVWVFTCLGPGGFEPYFPWPAIVTVVTGLNLARTWSSKDEILDRERRRLEKKQARAVERRDDPPELDA